MRKQIQAIKNGSHLSREAERALAVAGCLFNSYFVMYRRV